MESFMWLLNLIVKSLLNLIEDASNIYCEYWLYKLCFFDT